MCVTSPSGTPGKCKVKKADALKSHVSSSWSLLSTAPVVPSLWFINPHNHTRNKPLLCTEKYILQALETFKTVASALHHDFFVCLTFHIYIWINSLSLWAMPSVINQRRTLRRFTSLRRTELLIETVYSGFELVELIVTWVTGTYVG